MPYLTKLDFSYAYHNGNDNEFLWTENVAPLSLPDQSKFAYGAELESGGEIQIAIQMKWLRSLGTWFKLINKA